MHFDTCHVCGFHDLFRIPEYERLQRVTSDCKPWPPGGRLAVCRRCGCAEAITDANWQNECETIYREYTIYHQSQGAEQSVFDQTSGHAAARSDRLVERLQSELSLPERGRLLDVGCGNGALLRAFNRRRPEWTLAGVEVSDQHRTIVEQIPNVERLYTGDPVAVPGEFDLITLVHVLEHIRNPVAFLQKLVRKLKPGGHLMVEVPDCEQNPFMYVVADHATHFFRDRLTTTVACAGYDIVAAANDWIAKEITVLGRNSSSDALTPDAFNWPAMADPLAPVQRRIHWLQDIVALCRLLRSQGPFGVFGTSIAATWLFAELGGAIDFFVDEDPSRVGQNHLGRPIVAPGAAADGASLFIALPPFLARSVAARMHRITRARCHLPVDPA